MNKESVESKGNNDNNSNNLFHENVLINKLEEKYENLKPQNMLGSVKNETLKSGNNIHKDNNVKNQNLNELSNFKEVKINLHKEVLEENELSLDYPFQIYNDKDASEADLNKYQKQINELDKKDMNINNFNINKQVDTAKLSNQFNNTPNEIEGKEEPKSLNRQKESKIQEKYQPTKKETGFSLLKDPSNNLLPKIFEPINKLDTFKYSFNKIDKNNKEDAISNNESKQKVNKDSLLSSYKSIYELFPEFLKDFIFNTETDTIKTRKKIEKIINPLKEINFFGENETSLDEKVNFLSKFFQIEFRFLYPLTYYYQESQSDEIPMSREFPYSSIEKYNVKNFEFTFRTTPEKEELQLLLGIIDNQDKLIVKRTAIHFPDALIALRNKNNPSTEDYEIIKKFLEQFVKKNEEIKFHRFINLLIQDKKCSSTLYDVKIVYLPKINYLVIEAWQEFSGKTLSEINEFKEHDLKFAEKLADKLIVVANDFMKVGLLHNDLKPENIIVKQTSNDDFSLILIDFDISNCFSEGIISSLILNSLKILTSSDNILDIKELNNLVKINYAMRINRLKGYTYEYIPPEITKKLEESEQNPTLDNFLVLDSSQVYSLGIILLEAVGFLNVLHENKDNLDNYKSSPEKYEELINLILQFRKSKDNLLINKILTFVNYCFSYKPEDRLDLVHFNKFMEKSLKSFQSMTESDIEESFSQYKMDIKNSLSNEFKFNIRRYEEYLSNNFNKILEIWLSLKYLFPCEMQKKFFETMQFLKKNLNFLLMSMEFARKYSLLQKFQNPEICELFDFIKKFFADAVNLDIWDSANQEEYKFQNNIKIVCKDFKNKNKNKNKNSEEGKILQLQFLQNKDDLINYINIIYEIYLILIYKKSHDDSFQISQLLAMKEFIEYKDKEYKGNSPKIIQNESTSHDYYHYHYLDELFFPKKNENKNKSIITTYFKHNSIIKKKLDTLMKIPDSLDSTEIQVIKEMEVQLDNYFQKIKDPNAKINYSNYSNFKFKSTLTEIFLRYLYIRFSREFFNLPYLENDSEIIPKDHDSLYSNFENIPTENTIFKMKFESKETQIIFCSIQDEIKYIIKRTCIFFPDSNCNSKIIENQSHMNPKENSVCEDALNFLNLNILESHICNYYFSELRRKIDNFLFLPTSFGVKLTFLTKQNCLVMENMLQYVGESISDWHYFKFCHPEYLSNMINALLDMQFLVESSCLNLNYNIFSSKNIFVVNQSSQGKIFYYIDSSKFFSFFQLTPYYIQNCESTNYSEYSVNSVNLIGEPNDLMLDNSINSAAELVFNSNSSKPSSEKEKLDNCESGTYSIGVIILEAIGFFKEININFSNFCKSHFLELKKFYNNDYKDYKEFENSLNDYYEKQSNPIIRKAITLARFCLKFDANQRPSATEIFLYMKDFENATEEELIEAYDRIIQSRSQPPKNPEYLENLENLEKINLEILFNQNQDVLNFLRHWIDTQKSNYQSNM